MKKKSLWATRVKYLQEISALKQTIPMRNKVIIFIDKVAAKNKLQVEAINKSGLRGHFFAYQTNEISRNILFPNHTLELLSKNPLKQVSQVFNYIRKHSKSIHHLEIYPGSILSFYYLLTGKLFGLKIICVERGDLVYYHSTGYNMITRMSMRFCYRNSDVVWYRELFMKPVLEKTGAKQLFFLHNSVPIDQDEITPQNHRKNDFLWMNRVLPERRSDWFVQVLKKDLFKNTRNFLIGILPGSSHNREQVYIEENKTPNLTVKEFISNPKEYYKTSRFFVMPAEFIFANNALLEAMSYGVIPLISAQQGSELIVDNGISGFIFPHTFAGLEEAMQKGLNMNEQALEEMSKAARQKMITDFSEEKYINRIQELYHLIKK